MGCSRKDPYPPPPQRKLAIPPPSPSLDVVYKFKTFFPQSLPPPLWTAEISFVGGVGIFWNDPKVVFFTVLTEVSPPISTFLNL